MNRRGIALVLGLYVIMVLSVLSASYLYKQVNMSFLSNRYADSTQAFWVAEGGIQAARNNNLTQSSISGAIGAGSFVANIANINSSDYYEVVSTGTVGNITRTIDAVVSTRDVDADKFPFGIESTVAINFKGSSTVYGENTPKPVAKKTRDPEYYKQNSNFSFADLFCFSTTEIKSISTIYNNTWPSGNISGINWVIAPSSHFNGNVAGSGILIVEGDLRITGTINFDGIIYVIGELDMAGTAYVGGAILAESAATFDTDITGTADIEHSITKISVALDNIKYRSPQIVSWKELQE
jgi:Tfp pilus assembly protein PilX